MFFYVFRKAWLVAKYYGEKTLSFFLYFKPLYFPIVQKNLSSESGKGLLLTILAFLAKEI